MCAFDSNVVFLPGTASAGSDRDVRYGQLGGLRGPRQHKIEGGVRAPLLCHLHRRADLPSSGTSFNQNLAVFLLVERAG